MSTSATGGQLVFNYNTLLQRGLNLQDLSDIPTARANLGLSSANGLTLGSGLNPTGTSFNFSAPVTVSVNSSTTGTASTIAQYDTSGSLTTSGYVNIGYGITPTTSILNFNSGTTGALASITRGAGTNGALTISNSGTGGLVLGATSLNGGFTADTITTSGVLTVASGSTPVASTINFNSGTASSLGSLSRATGTNGGMLLTNTGTGGVTVNGSLVSLVSSGAVSSLSATSTTVTSATGTTVGLASGATGSTSLTVNSTGSAGAGNQALAVSGGATIDTVTVSGLTGGVVYSTSSGVLTTTAPQTNPSFYFVFNNFTTTSTGFINIGAPAFNFTGNKGSVTVSSGSIQLPKAGRYLVTISVYGITSTVPASHSFNLIYQPTTPSATSGALITLYANNGASQSWTGLVDAVASSYISCSAVINATGTLTAQTINVTGYLLVG